MALESFYGGKPGFSPVIKAKFKYIDISDSPWKDSLETLTEENKKQIMNECFKDPNYKDVWYGELCIIDSENKLDLNNGKLFRRTLKKVDDAKNSIYAEYLGQISGPAGGIPKIHVGSIDSEIQKVLGNSATYDGENVANLDPSKWDYSYINSENEVTSVKPENETSFGTINALTEGMFVPGNTSQEIQYTWCNVRRNDEDHIMYLGFKIPYTVFDIDAKIENYTYNGSYFEDNSEGKPFWKKYTIHVPRGVRGIGPEEIKWVNKSDFPSTSTIYTTDAIIYQRNEETGIEKYGLDNDDHKKMTREELPSKFWVGLWKLYNQSTNDIISAYIYLGEYKAVEGFELSTDGYISVRYSGLGSDGVLEKLKQDTPIKWISSTTWSPDSGFLTLIHNTKEKNSETQETTLLKMPMIRELWIDSRGHLLALYPSSCRPRNDAASNPTSSNSLYPESTANVDGLYNEQLLWVKGTNNNKIANTIGIWWHDLGLVYKVLSPKIVTSFDAENIEDISSSLNSKYPNGVITTDENVTISEGGMIAVENVPSSDGQTTETRIYYYNYEKGSWQDLGPYTGGSSGGSGNNSNVRIEGYSTYRDDDIGRRVSEDNFHILYPKNSNSEIHFGSSEIISKSLDGSVNPSGEVNNYEVLGYGTSLFSYVSNERSVVGTAKVGEANVKSREVSR